MSPPASIRQTLSRRKRWINGIMLASLLPMPVAFLAERLLEIPALLLPGLAIPFGGALAATVLALRTRCPSCGTSWRRLLRTGPPWRIHPRLLFCPWCRAHLDEEPPSPEEREAAVPPARLILAAGPVIDRLITASAPSEESLPMRKAFARRGWWCLELGAAATLLLLPIAALALAGRPIRIPSMVAIALFSIAFPTFVFRISLACRTCRGPWMLLADLPWRISPRARCCPWCGADPDAEPL